MTLRLLATKADFFFTQFIPKLFTRPFQPPTQAQATRFTGAYQLAYLESEGVGSSFPTETFSGTVSVAYYPPQQELTLIVAINDAPVPPCPIRFHAAARRNRRLGLFDPIDHSTLLGTVTATTLRVNALDQDGTCVRLIATR